MSENRYDLAAAEAAAVLSQFRQMSPLTARRLIGLMTPDERQQVTDLQQILDAANERWAQDRNTAQT